MKRLSKIESEVLLLICAGLLAAAQAPGHQIAPITHNHVSQTEQSNPDAEAEAELEKGTALTRQGSFVEAIPHLLAAGGRASNHYAVGFNLSLCYVATGQPKQ